MYKISLFLFILLLFAGCSSKTSHAINPAQKIFEEEDQYILFALRAEELQEFNASASIYYTLYERSKKDEYLLRALRSDLSAKNNEKVLALIDEMTKGSLENPVLVRLKIVALLQMQRIKEAKELSIALVNRTNEVDDYILVSDIYSSEKNFNMSLKYLESAYAKNYDERVLDKMSIVLYVDLARKNDAIAQLETHIRVHGCSELICARLAGFYSDKNDIEGLLSIYLKLYGISQNSDIADRIVKIYRYKGDEIRLIEFLQESKSNDALLLQLFINTKRYKEASKLAYELYEKTGEIDYLGSSAIFDYEGHKNKADKAMHKRVIEKLKKTIAQNGSPLYLNYLGYLMIDHEINVKQGMKHVRKALKIEPESAYYLDSLAWGYYKLGNCNEAMKIINRVRKLEGGDDKEVQAHYEKIQQCIKGAK
ncbi:MAG: hypothetical protein IE916_00945 [Epsilonproteobacteria bacterium]|nr:hypothetical protein [Campylobacterota bacterium]